MVNMNAKTNATKIETGVGTATVIVLGSDEVAAASGTTARTEGVAVATGTGIENEGAKVTTGIATGGNEVKAETEVARQDTRRTRPHQRVTAMPNNKVPRVLMKMHTKNPTRWGRVK